MHPDLKRIEGIIDLSPWLAANTPEPLIGDPECPGLADSWGPRGISIYCVFVEERGDNAFGCRNERCYQYITHSLECAIRHQRHHHFNHSPFVCVPPNGAPWSVLYSLLLFSSSSVQLSANPTSLNSGRRFFAELDLMHHQQNAH